MRWSLLALLFGFALVLVACGDDDGSSSSGSSSAPAADDDDDAAAADDGEGSDAAGADDGSGADGEASADDAVDEGSDGAGVPVGLSEFVVDMADTLAAGSQTFDIANSGSFPHQLTIVAGDGYESLPKLDNGAVDEDALDPGAIIGSTENIGGGSTSSLSVDLAPGTYVFYCNISLGPNSHAGQGQTLTVTVS